MNLNKIYRLKNLSLFGKIALAVMIILLAISSFIPAHQYKEPKQQLYTINGTHFKYGDQEKIKHFIESIKLNKGYLCIGTSESGFLQGKNYQHFLNNDNELSAHFSILSGAGRTCGIHLPWLHQNKNTAKGLNLIYYVNPVYWNTNLNEIALNYTSRYLNYKFANSFKNESFTSEQYTKEFSLFNQVTYTLEYYIRSARHSYFNDLKEYLNSINWEEKSTKINPVKTPVTLDSNTLMSEIDSVYNIKKSFANKNWFRPIDTTTNYRTKELQNFITQCQSIGINITLVVGPYNEKFIANYQPEAVEGYKQTVIKIKKMATDQNVDFVDCTNLSNQAGMFDDHQHHSQLAAKEIANKIKLHVLQK